MEKKIRGNVGVKVIINKCKQLGKTFKQYLEESKYNYVIIDADGHVVRFNDGEYVVYGDKEDAMEACNVEGDFVVTEEDFLKACLKYYQLEDRFGNVLSPFGNSPFMVFDSKASAKKYKEQIGDNNAKYVKYTFDDIEAPTFIKCINGKWQEIITITLEIR